MKAEIEPINFIHILSYFSEFRIIKEKYDKLITLTYFNNFSTGRFRKGLIFWYLDNRYVVEVVI